jgi:thymidylate synthase (FAD)
MKPKLHKNPIKLVEPLVRCIAKTQLHEAQIADFLGAESAEWSRPEIIQENDRLIEFSGRICYMSFGARQSPRSNAEYVRNLIDSGHESVLEHSSWTFLATGVSRGFTHQLVRHRVGFSFSQLSQQYYDESEASFVAPPSLKRGTQQYSLWETAMQDALKKYRAILASARELAISTSFEDKEQLREIRSTARSVLPNSIEAKIVFSANGRAIRHFLATRGSIEGDWEMRNVSVQLFNIVSHDAPAIFQDFELRILDDGSKSVVQL